jgi:hypothetical protein
MADFQVLCILRGGEMQFKEQWEDYKKILPKSAGKVQVIETEQAFYSGAYTFYAIIMKNSELPEGQAIKFMENLHNELKERLEAMIMEKFRAF